MGSTLNSQALSGTYSVFTGTDIYTVFCATVISTMQGLSYSITRQKAPIYTMGSPDCRAIARSKRGIAGSMIMTTFDRHSLADFMRESKFAAKLNSAETTSSINPMMGAAGSSAPFTGEYGKTIQTSPVMGTASVQTLLSGVGAAAQSVLTAAPDQMSIEATPMMSDQLMPFDTTLMASNEYGLGSAMRLFGLEVLNEGSGVSVDDTSNEVQMTYLARFVSPWTQQKSITSTI